MKRARSLPPEEFLLPQKLVEQLRRGEGKHGKTHDSGFNSEQNRFFLQIDKKTKIQKDNRTKRHKDTKTHGKTHDSGFNSEQNRFLILFTKY